MSAVTHFLFESCLGHFLKNKMPCENLTQLVKQETWQMPQKTKCCSGGDGDMASLAKSLFCKHEDLSLVC